jgi:hypothetical protein
MTTTKVTTLGSELTILKQDSRGRVRTSAARREQLLDEFEHSGLSGPKFAELVGVKYQTFATWVQKRKRKGGSASSEGKVPAPARVKWLEAVVGSSPATAAGSPLELQLPGGVRLEVADEKQAVLAAILVRALTQPC